MDILIQVEDADGVRHWTAHDSELAKKFGPAPDKPKVVSDEAEVDPQGEDRDTGGNDEGPGDRKPKAK
jgi:hypothetical protein